MPEFTNIGFEVKFMIEKIFVITERENWEIAFLSSFSTKIEFP